MVQMLDEVLPAASGGTEKHIDLGTRHGIHCTTLLDGPRPAYNAHGNGLDFRERWGHLARHVPRAAFRTPWTHASARVLLQACPCP